MKKAKLWVELIFIFALPLIFMVLCFSFKTVNLYDVNNNLLTSQKVLDVNDVSFLRDYNDNVPYINYLHYNQLIRTYSATLILTSDYNTIGWIDGDNSPVWIIEDYSNNLILNHKYFGYFNYENTYGLRVSNGRQNNNMTGFFTINQTVDNYYERNYLFKYDSTVIPSGTYFFEYNLIDLTVMFGSGYEPSTNNDLLQYFNYNFNDYVHDDIIEFVSNNQISIDFNYNYTWYTAVFKNLFDSLQLEYNIILQIVISYTILWFIMFIIWHLFYLPFDFLMHLCRKE